MISEDAVKIGWRAPSNIALVKYWGKRTFQLPENGSLSITLEKSGTTTFLSFKEKVTPDHDIMLKYYFHGVQHLKFENKIIQFLSYLRLEMPFLTNYELIFQSENNFPHSAGIASSASSMAAIALCLVSMEEIVSHLKLRREDFFRRASTIARMGSGSASRSVYGGVVSWGISESIDQSSDEYATPFQLPMESRLHKVRDIILIVSSKEKSVSSSLGHALMNDHPYREGRKVQANNHLIKMSEAIRNNNYRDIAIIAEHEAFSLHALLMSSSPDGLLLLPNTLHIIEEIKQFRKSTGFDLFFTIDAGPNVHLIYFEDNRELVLLFVEQTLSRYCEDGRWIDDETGSGPELLTKEYEC